MYGGHDVSLILFAVIITALFLGTHYLAHRLTTKD
jgi:hypothetical protein